MDVEKASVRTEDGILPQSRVSEIGQALATVVMMMVVVVISSSRIRILVVVEAETRCRAVVATPVIGIAVGDVSECKAQKPVLVASVMYPLQSLDVVR